ncbi:disease resistance protein (TIR-NBS-LRR class) family [Artemisia annua]|uniref:Disease resistance protein (TIR-NBS-LRR class) family n=1 Tax=Artemisia annua TaxID=35608 RepID=A0A2U1PQ19_ARTAN|nr:disease resistance protein (TIR-NBS-LRR class) family [Artemisia annua]
MSFSKILRFSDPSSLTSLGITLMLMLMGFIYYYFYSKASSSNSSAPEIMVSTSTSSIQKRFKYDVFISFRGEDTRKNFVDHLYHALKDKCIYTYKDDEKIQKGQRISDDLFQSIEESKFYIIVFSKNYASSSWCLEELVKIMECQKMSEHTAYPVFYDVEPTEVRNQSGSVRKAFFKNKKKEAAEKWKGALKEAADLAGWELKNTLDGHEAKFIKKIVQEISLQLRPINLGFDEKLVGMETRVKDVVSSLEVGTDEVRMIGIKGMGGAGKTTTARAVFDHLSNFEAKSFVKNVREVSNGSVSGLKELQEQVLSDVLNVQVTLRNVDDGKDMMKWRMPGKKVLLVLDDVDHIDQLEALASGPNWFKPGSRIIVTTRDEQVLVAHRVNLIRDIDLLSDKEAICLFSRYAFGTENPVQGYEELSGKVVRYAAGLPLTLKVLGSFLCGKDKDEWVDAIERLKEIPLQETLKKLELSYMSLEDDYKEIFLDIACILKGRIKEYAIRILESCGFHARNGLKETLKKLELSYMSLEDDYKEIFLDIACILKGRIKEYAIRILESCGFHARNGLKVLEQRSLITISKDEVLGMHDHIEEMGKNIVRRSHPDEPNKHSRLWIDEEIEDILANDKDNEATSCLKLDMQRGNPRILMKGLGKMKKLRYLDVDLPHFGYQSDPKFDYLDVDLPNSLKYLKCWDYPFLYLPKTFRANNLVGLEMRSIRMVKLWEEGEKKVLKKLKFLSLNQTNLTTFDFRITPNLEWLSVKFSDNLKELCMPVTCQKLKHLEIHYSKLRSFDLGLTPNLETLSLYDCVDFVELHVSVACPNLKFLNLYGTSREVALRSLDLELIPNLERLDLRSCRKLVEINAPVGCLKKVGYLNLGGFRFTGFEFFGRSEPNDSRSSASLVLAQQWPEYCPLHPNSNLPQLQFRCSYKECLPSSVGNIEKLISFGLCACTDLKKFSDIICSLQCLTSLTLKCNIPEFPKDLGQLECLEELYLSSTKIKHLPDSICMLKHLKSLTVDRGDLLEKLPEDLGKLECLEKLKVSSKKIKYLPYSICMLKRLKSLKVKNGDFLDKLPEDLGQLECLEELHVSSSKIEYLPDSICMLKRLKSLDVTECCLVKLPEDIGRLESLERLDLSATQISSSNICMFKHLKYLKLSSCDLLEKLPEDLGLLECLEELDVSSKKIEYLPDSICMLKCLKWLFVTECCRLDKLPEDIGQLESLERLALWGTMIKHLPDSICMLKHLKHLYLSHCALLEKLPEDLGRLECLKYLDITDTGISHLPQSIFGLKDLFFAAPPELLQLYDFPSEMQTRTSNIR